VPASQISDAYIRDLSSVVGTTIDVLITEFDLRKKRVIGSARVIIEKEKEESLGKLWDEIEVGKEYEGTIKSFVDFGAFVNIGPIDGLLHISEMSWSQIKHPSDIFKVGETIKVTILSYDKAKKKVSLGFRREEDNPWFKISDEIKAGDEIDVRIVRIVPFGAFAEIKPGVEGLIHISNISHKRIGHPAEVLRIDEIVRVKVLEVDEGNKRVALSIKELLAPDAEPEEVSKEEVEDPNSHSEELDVSLGDVIDFNIQK
jgi:4-hydroxy-3-methylbut-2-enyl diphosphate reductase